MWQGCDPSAILTIDLTDYVCQFSTPQEAPHGQTTHWHDELWIH
jgi:hypothetical protein